MTSDSTSKPQMSRIETANLNNAASSSSGNANLLSSSNNNTNTSTSAKSPISASKTAAFFGESHVFQPPKSHFRSASNSSNSSGNGSSSRLASSSSPSGNGSNGLNRSSLVSQNSKSLSGSGNTSSTEMGSGAGKSQIGDGLPISDSLQSIDSRSDFDRSWSRNDISSNSIIKSNSKTDLNIHNNSIDHQTQIPTSSSNSFSSRWADGFGSSLQPQPQSSNSLYDGNQNQNANSSSIGNGSVRSRRNWDEFEGKPLTPLPSPNLSTSNKTFDFGSTNEKEEEGNQSAVGFGLNGKKSSIYTTTIPSSISSSSSSSETASKTESFFKSSRTPKPPTNRKSSGSSDFSSSNQDEISSRSNSAFDNRFQLHQTTRLPTLLTGDTIPGTSNVITSSVLTSSSIKSGSSNNGGSWLGPGHMRSSSGESDSSLRGGTFSDSPIVTMDPHRPFKSPSNVQKESGWGTLSSGYSPTSSRLRESRNGLEDEGNNLKGSGSSLSTSSMDFLMPSESSSGNGNGRRSNGGNTTRHTHGPSENASGSSLIPNFFQDDQEELQNDHFAHRRGKSKEGLPTTSDGSNSFLFKSQNENESQANEKQDLKVQTTFRLPSSSHSPNERIGNSKFVENTKSKEEEFLEDEDESQSLIGPYKVVSILGVGAFSKVVLGEKFRELKGKQIINSSSNSNGESITPSLSKLVHSNQDYLGAPEVFVRRPSVTPEEREKEPIRQKAQENNALEFSVRDKEMEEQEMKKSNEILKKGEDKLVALKIMAREPCEQNERMRVSWVREVEVLKHISHPSLARFISSFSTPSQHVLVIERIEGGELFDLLDKNQIEVSKREWLVRRLYAEMANAVGWMHSVNLVHRDLKLENVVLTTRLFESSKDLSPSSLPPIPLLKITDFGLSRFVDPNGPLLETRCGSEEYAAPELIIGKRYDGRQTDVWALGVVLYALLTGSIPFLDDNPTQSINNVGGKNSREDSTSERDSKQRKSHLLRIAKGDLRWPSRTNDLSKDVIIDEEKDCLLINRLITPRARNFVSKLLRRDSSKRISAWESWDDLWLTEGSFLGMEESQNGERFELEVKDPRSNEGKKWLRENAGVRGERLSGVVLDD